MSQQREVPPQNPKSKAELEREYREIHEKLSKLSNEENNLEVREKNVAQKQNDIEQLKIKLTGDRSLLKELETALSGEGKDDEEVIKEKEKLDKSISLKEEEIKKQQLAVKAEQDKIEEIKKLRQRSDDISQALDKLSKTHSKIVTESTQKIPLEDSAQRKWTKAYDHAEDKMSKERIDKVAEKHQLSYTGSNESGKERGIFTKGPPSSEPIIDREGDTYKCRSSNIKEHLAAVEIAIAGLKPGSNNLLITSDDPTILSEMEKQAAKELGSRKDVTINGKSVDQLLQTRERRETRHLQQQEEAQNTRDEEHPRRPLSRAQ